MHAQQFTFSWNYYASTLDNNQKRRHGNLDHIIKGFLYNWDVKTSKGMEADSAPQRYVQSSECLAITKQSELCHFLRYWAIMNSFLVYDHSTQEVMWINERGIIHSPFKCRIFTFLWYKQNHRFPVATGEFKLESLVHILD